MESTKTFSAVEWLARTEEVAVRICTLDPGQRTAWHFHSVVADDVFALDDGIEVELRDPTSSVTLHPADRHRVEPRQVHSVANRSSRPARYLLVQATGRYDFNEVP